VEKVHAFFLEDSVLFSDGKVDVCRCVFVGRIPGRERRITCTATMFQTGN